MSEVKRYYSFFTSHPGDWRPCSKEHHDMVRANPQDWPGYEVRELAVIPAGHVVVSEGLLRRLLDSDGIDGIFDAQQNYAAHQELRALLDEIDRLKAENEALLLGMRAILNAYDYADQYKKEGVAVEVMEDLRTLFKGATK
ncbi:hypothetical protein ACJU4I_10810 [Pseudomonas aeruginosa]|uniref:hypothetical protein n=1 Tax=Pseudomonas aeruginosa TaxID=287 RepID=UPI0038884707